MKINGVKYYLCMKTISGKGSKNRNQRRWYSFNSLKQDNKQVKTIRKDVYF